jgi:hypothetical protein
MKAMSTVYICKIVASRFAKLFIPSLPTISLRVWSQLTRRGVETLGIYLQRIFIGAFWKICVGVVLFLIRDFAPFG